MDTYTRATLHWLDQRFALFTDGIYLPNQPSYGFSKVAERLEEYARTMAILAALDRLAPASLLDVGAADGYFPEFVRRAFGAPTIGAELSGTACLRAWELYGLPVIPADAHQLPFRDGAFDVTVCSEVLEHVTDPARVISELWRVTAGALVLTTPRAKDQQTKAAHFDNLDPNEPHAHIHYFTEEDMRALLPARTLLWGARSKLTARLWPAIAEDIDGREASFRKALFDFVAATSEMTPARRAGLHSALLDRYDQPPGLLARMARPRAIKHLLLLDLWLARRRPALCHDFLAIALRPGRQVGPPRRPAGRLLDNLLFDFHVPPLRAEMAARR